MAAKHAVSRPECTSKHQELVRQVSEGQSTMIIDALHKALSSSKVAVDEDDEEMGECVRCMMIQRSNGHPYTQAPRK